MDSLKESQCGNQEVARAETLKLHTTINFSNLYACEFAH